MKLYLKKKVNYCENCRNYKNLAILQCPNNISMPLCESPTRSFPIYPRHTFINNVWGALHTKSCTRHYRLAQKLSLNHIAINRSH